MHGTDTLEHICSRFAYLISYFILDFLNDFLTKSLPHKYIARMVTEKGCHLPTSLNHTLQVIWSFQLKFVKVIHCFPVDKSKHNENQLLFPDEQIQKNLILWPTQDYLQQLLIWFPEHWAIVQ